MFRKKRLLIGTMNCATTNNALFGNTKKLNKMFQQAKEHGNLKDLFVQTSVAMHDKMPYHNFERMKKAHQFFAEKMKESYDESAVQKLMRDYPLEFFNAGWLYYDPCSTAQTLTQQSLEPKINQKTRGAWVSLLPEEFWYNAENYEILQKASAYIWEAALQPLISPNTPKSAWLGLSDRAIRYFDFVETKREQYADYIQTMLADFQQSNSKEPLRNDEAYELFCQTTTKKLMQQHNKLQSVPRFLPAGAQFAINKAETLNNPQPVRQA